MDLEFSWDSNLLPSQKFVIDNQSVHTKLYILGNILKTTNAIYLESRNFGKRIFLMLSKIFLTGY